MGDRLQAVAVKEAVGDADTLIVSTALHHATEIQPLAASGADTDLEPFDSNIFQVNPGHSKAPQKMFDVHAIQEALSHLKNNLLFLHAVTGCDTISVPYQQGRRKGYKVLKSNDHLAQTVTVFNIPEVDAEDIAKASKDFLLALYGASISQPTANVCGLHVSILLGRTVKCSSGWKMTLIQPNWDGF